jgi:hypothetical protein
MRRAGLLLLAGALAATVLSGCGSHTKPTTAELTLERADLVAVIHGLQALEGPLASAMSASRIAWPYVVNGLSRDPAKLGVAQVTAAATAAAAIRVPAVLGETDTAELTGPASPIAGTFRTFIGLLPRGWKLIEGSIAEIQGGRPAAAQFARETVALYIESVYDGLFSLGQIGKKVTEGFKQLGGASAFAGSLSEAEAQALAKVYSEASFRLQPHAGVKLGS